MDYLNKLKKFSLNAIIGIIWFELLWFAILVISNVFKWSFITSQIKDLFFTLGIGGIFIVLGFTLLNVSVNLNLISESVTQKIKQTEKPSYKKKMQFKYLLISSVVLIVLIVLIFWLAEYQTFKMKRDKIENKLMSLNNTDVVDDMIKFLSKKGKIKDGKELLHMMGSTIEEPGRLSIIFPKRKKNVILYYHLTSHTYIKENHYLSDANLNIFYPYDNEKRKFIDFTKDKKKDIIFFSYSRYLRAYYKIKKENKVQFIILLDTSRQLDYRKSSFK